MWKLFYYLSKRDEGSSCEDHGECLGEAFDKPPEKWKFAKASSNNNLVIKIFSEEGETLYLLGLLFFSEYMGLGWRWIIQYYRGNRNWHFMEKK